MFAIKAVIKTRLDLALKKTPYASEQGAIFIFMFTNGISAFWMIPDYTSRAGVKYNHPSAMKELQHF